MLKLIRDEQNEIFHIVNNHGLTIGFVKFDDEVFDVVMTMTFIITGKESVIRYNKYELRRDSRGYIMALFEKAKADIVDFMNSILEGKV